METTFWLRLKNSDFKFYALSFCMGLAVYSLKLISLKNLIENTSLDSYPSLMLICGIFFWIFNQTIDSILKNKKHYYYFSFIAPLSIFAIQASGQAQSYWATLSIFLLSTSLISAMDTTLKNIFSENTSVLKNPHISHRLTLMEELGTLGAACWTWLLPSKGSSLDFFLAILPFAGALAAIYFIHLNKEESFQESEEQNQEVVGMEKFPFTKWIVGTFAVLLILKQVQGFAVFLGFEALQKSGGSFNKIFAIINIVQTVAIFVVLSFSSFNVEFKSTWNKGLRNGFSVQAWLMFGLMLLPFPTMYFLSGAVRKIIQHSILNPSMTILNSALPASIRMKLKSNMEGYGNLFSYLFLAGFSYLGIHQIIGYRGLWFISGALALAGLYFRKKLFDSLAEHQIQVVNSQEEVFQAAGACYSLATPEAYPYSEQLMDILENSSSHPIMQKAVIYTLGEIQNPRASYSMIASYHQTDREDIQFCIIQALLRFESHHLDLFLLESLEAIITTQVSLGEIRKNVLKAIIVRVSHTAIPMILKILQNKAEEPRVVANAIIVLGEIAENNKDDSLYEFLALYTEENYPRRIRSNALIYLYSHSRYRSYVEGILEKLSNSSDEFDRSAVSFIAGELKLKKFLPFIYKNSEAKEHTNSTLLIALLKLEYFDICAPLARVMISTDSNVAITAINQLSAIEDPILRYKVYYQVLNSYPSSYYYLVDLLKASKRDFDSDLNLLQTEAKRLGIKAVSIEAENGIISLKNAA